MLIDHGAEVNAKVTVESAADRPGLREHAGWTALMFAVERGDTTLVRALLAKGAAVDVRAADERTTALPLASTRARSRPIADLLRKAGAKE